MRRFIVVPILFLAGLVGPQSLNASDTIWSALVLATNESPPRTGPRKLERFAPTIQKVFGYNSLYLLGDSSNEITSGTEQWLVPSRDFFFQVACKSRDDTRYVLRLELFRGDSPLLTTEVRLARNAPLYVRGPQWGDGQLVLLLEIR
jgi:hypothetical protein